MSDFIEMRGDAQDAGRVGNAALNRLAGIHPIPSNGGDGGHSRDDTQNAGAAVAKLPRKRGGAVHLEVEPQIDNDSTATIPASAGPDRARYMSSPKSGTPGQDNSPRKRGRPATQGAETVIASPAATDASQEAGEATWIVKPIGRAPPPKTPRKGPRARGQEPDKTHPPLAASADQFESQTSTDTQRPDALDGDPGHARDETHHRDAGVANLIAEIRALWRRRQTWHRAEKKLTNQMFAICWSSLGGGTETKVAAGKMLARIEAGTTLPGDIYAEISCVPFIAARPVFRDHRMVIEKTLAKLARGLPAHEWVKGVRGVGDLSFAAIVGEAGAPGEYKSVSALWKRMGLAVIDGERQRRVKGDAALDHGYAPARRSVMWNIGGGLIGGMGNGPRPGVGEDVSGRDDLTRYQKIFIERLRYEADRDPATHRKEPVASAKTGELRESFSTHAANRARRYVEKRFLRDLFAEWRRANTAPDPSVNEPAADPISKRPEARRLGAVPL